MSVMTTCIFNTLKIEIFNFKNIKFLDIKSLKSVLETLERPLKLVNSS